MTDAFEVAQLALLGEAVEWLHDVAVFVWDEDRHYVAANQAACDLLGSTLDEIIGATVGERTKDGEDVVGRAIRQDVSRGRLTAERFDGSGEVTLEYLTFATHAAGLPYMASLIWPAGES